MVLMICTCLTLTSRSTKAADWPTYRGDNRRSGISTEMLKVPMKEIWVHKAAHPPQPAWPRPAEHDLWHRIYGLSPTMTYDRAFHTVVVGGNLYYGSSAEDTVYCLDAATGKTRWSFVTEGPIRLVPTIARRPASRRKMQGQAAGKVYVGSDDGCVYCLDARDARLLWRHQAGPEDKRLPGNGRMISLWPVRCGIVVDRDVVYFSAGLFPSHGVYLCAVSAEDGKEIWKHKINVPSQGYLLASTTRLFVPTGRTPFRVFDRRDGKNLQDLGSYKRLRGGGGSFAVLVENTIATGPSEDGKIHTFDASSREKIVSTPAVRMLANGDITYTVGDDKISALNRKRYIRLSRQIVSIEKINQQKRTERQKKRLVELKKQREACLKWQVPCSAPYELVMAGNILFAGGNDKVFAYSATDGRQLWTGSVSGKAYGLAVSDGCLFVSTDKGIIHCFAQGRPVVASETISGVPSCPYPRDRWTSLYKEAADTIIKDSNVNKGYCLVLAAGTGRLAYEIAKRSELRIIGVEEDAEKAATARKLLSEAGLYGARITIHQGKLEKLPYQKYFANLVISDQTLCIGELPPSAEEIFRVLRPCGGVIMLGQPTYKQDKDNLTKWGRISIPGWKVSKSGNLLWGMAHRDKLKGEGQWTHLYADVGNTACSGDTLVGGIMELQWFGRPGPRKMIDRHHKNVPPLYKSGRLFVPGDNIFYAIDAYNGTILWNVTIPDSRRLAAAHDCGNMAVDDEYLYIAAADSCYGFDVRSGRKNLMYRMPQLMSGQTHEWGYLAYSDNILFGSGCKKGASYTEISREIDSELRGPGQKTVTSEYLFAMDRSSGQIRWTYISGIIVNTTITIGGNRIYFIETHSSKALADERGRMATKAMFDGGEQFLVALDMQTGKIAYKKKMDVSNFDEVIYLSYADDVLLLSGGKAVGKYLRYYFYAFDANTGKLLWNKNHDSGLKAEGTHGEQTRHPTIIGDTVYTWPYAYKLNTGRRLEGWKFDRRGHGCGAISASGHCLFWRGGNSWMYDLRPEAGPSRLDNVTRPGCWINIIPAGGLVLIPEYSSGCTCAYPFQTSMALVPSSNEVGRCQ